MDTSTRRDFDEAFPDEASARRWFIQQKWPTGPVCPACGGKDLLALKTRPTWFHCRACRTQTSLTSGTPLHGSQKPLRDWLYAIWRSLGENCWSAKKLQRDLGYASYQTAWTMLHKIRVGLSLDRPPLSGPDVVVGYARLHLTRRAKGDPPLRPGPLLAVASQVPSFPAKVGRTLLLVAPDPKAGIETIDADVRLAVAERPTATQTASESASPHTRRHWQTVVWLRADALGAFLERCFGGVSRRYLQNYVAQFLANDPLVGGGLTLAGALTRVLGQWRPTHNLRTAGFEAVA